MPSASRQPLAAARAAAALTGRFRPPGDKSVSHRALILGAMAIGETAITGLLEAEDVLHTAKAVAALGAEVAHDGPGRWRVHGVGTGGFAEPGVVIDCGNSGTGVRLLMGAVATTPISVTFTGDASLCRRPMGRVLTPLALFGATALGREGGRLPLTLRGAAQAVPVRYVLPVPSAQVKSAVLLAGLAAPGVTTVVEPEATRDHTERMVRAFGGTVCSESAAEGLAISITGEVELKPAAIQVPSDPSSAAFPLVAALLVPGSSVTAEGVMLNPTRTGLFATLREMGAHLTVSAEREQGGEQVGDVTATFTGALKGVDVPPERAPSMIDEYPILAVLAAFAEGRTVLRGLSELRVKESDRLSAIARGLAVNGISVTEQEDSLIIEGRGAEGVAGGGVVATAMDHRIAMSFLVMGLAAQKPVEIDDAAFIATSFPEFVTLMERLGASFCRLNR